MAAKLLHTLADDNADLQKQIGCVNVISQIFDRRHVLTGRRSPHTRLTLGSTNVDIINFERNSIDVFNQQRSPFQDSSFNRREKQRLLMKSSRRSFSSSLSSSEFNRGAQPEASSFDRFIFQESPIKDTAMRDGSEFRNGGQKSLDLRDVVRDSMYNEARGVPIRNPITRTEVERRNRREYTMKPRNLKELTEIDYKKSPHHSIDSNARSRSKQKPEELPRLSFDSKEHVIGHRASRVPPTVVAKLMGLEALPGSPVGRDNHWLRPKKTEPVENMNRHIRSSPRQRNSDFVMKPISTSRFPVELAPWRKIDRQMPLHKEVSKSVKTPLQVVSSSSNSSSPSVYGEIEKRLKDLKFEELGTDLRVLKQLLEAMQSKGFLETKSSNFAAQRDYETSNSVIASQDPGGAPSSSPSSSSSSSSLEVRESPIVIMKPAKLVEKTDIPVSSRIPIRSISSLSKIHRDRHLDDKIASISKWAEKDHSPRNRRSESCTSSQNLQSMENTSKSSGSISPKLRKKKKKLELEICSSPPTPSLDSSRSRKQVSQKPKESASRNIPSLPITTHDIKGDGPNDSGEDQWDPAFSFSETTSGFSPEINRRKLQNVQHLVEKLRRLNSSHDESSQDYIASLCENTDSNFDQRYISEILLASGLLLRDFGSGLASFQPHLSGLPINPELFLVLEQMRGSSYTPLLNREETKVLNDEKLHRKLVFDTVNEILVEKLGSMEMTRDLWMKSAKMVKRSLSGQQILQELCTEIKALQDVSRKRLENCVVEEEDDFFKSPLAEDLMFRSGKWPELNGELPGLVLDVERLLFKELVDEIVHGQVHGLPGKTSW